MSENIKIIDDEKPYLSSERMDTPFGTRHSGSLLTLTQEHIEALQSGKTLLLDVEGEYVVSLNGETAIESGNSQRVDVEKVIDDLKTIVFTTTNATGEGDLDSALRLYFEKVNYGTL